MRRSICVLVSGGLDSDVLLAELAKQYSCVWPVYIRQHLVWETVELYWLKRYLRALHSPRIKPLRVLTLPMEDVYETHWSLGRKPAPGSGTADAAVYLPGRNQGLTVKAAVFCAMTGILEIALGSLNHNPFPDATPAFLKIWGKALGQGLASPLKIRAPFRSLSKAEVIRRGRDLPLQYSFSCLAPKRRVHCGRCNKCAERRRAFREAGVLDRTIYAKR
ncbi:MAG: 7-cyano-7-deazaguanine synthase [Elusimicrobiota bacterium]|jgi:7-cyano-7-deazaguanine synthase